MEGMKEVEIKARISEEEAGRLEENVFEGKEEVTEKDTYFTSPIRDFIETNECLRIRERDGKALEMTYKGRTTERMRNENQFWKEEIDLPLESKENAEQLLLAVGCEKLVEVVKHRRKAEVDGKVLTLDRIDDTGAFVEVESEVVQEEVEKALKENKKLLKQIGIDGFDVVNKPYRDLVMESKGIEY